MAPVAQRRPTRTHSVLGLPPLLGLAQERGLDPVELLRRARIPAAALEDPMARIPFERECALVRIMLERTGEATLGLAAGKRYRLAAFGLLGSVIGAVLTPRDAIRIFLEHLHLTYTPFAVTWIEQEQGGRLCFVDDVELRELRRFYLDRDLAFLLETANTLWPGEQQVLARAVELDYPEPPEVAAYQVFAPCPVRFGADVAAVLLDPDAGQPRPAASSLALRLLEDHLRAFGMVDASADLPGRVRQQIAIVVATRRTLPDEEAVAEALGLSSRTLRRQLEQAGESFRRLADAALSNIAQRHLRESSLTVYEVAERLGYGEAASFVRAFRRWTGDTPESYRKRCKKARAV